MRRSATLSSLRIELRELHEAGAYRRLSIASELTIAGGTPAIQLQFETRP